jgi:hypothetical protein
LGTLYPLQEFEGTYPSKSDIGLCESVTFHERSKDKGIAFFRWMFRLAKSFLPPGGHVRFDEFDYLVVHQGHHVGSFRSYEI